MTQQTTLQERRWKLSRIHGLLDYFRRLFVSWDFQRNDGNLCFGMKHVGRGYKVSASFVPNSKSIMFQCHYPDPNVVVHRYYTTVDSERSNGSICDEVMGSLLPEYVREFDRKFRRAKPKVKASKYGIEQVMIDLKLARSHLRMLEARIGVGSRTLAKVRSAIKSFEGAVRFYRDRLDR